MFSGCKKSTSGSEGASGRGEFTARQTQEAAETTRIGLGATPRQDGPTVSLFGQDGEYPENRLADFMYFVPLISPVLVSAVTSPDNEQAGYLLSYESDKVRDSFYVSCEFRMKGAGFYLNEFDVDATIEWNTKPSGRKKVLKNMLNYIKFEGTGYGRIEARGKIVGSASSPQGGSVMTVENVEVHFDARGAESPVTVGLYDVDVSKKEGGGYKQYNYKVARITTLTFARSEGAPKMGLKISAVGKSESTLGAWEHIKGFFGNFFIEPIKIDRLGNETMLQLGLDLYNKQPKFTFPIARNLKVKE